MSLLQRRQRELTAGVRDDGGEGSAVCRKCLKIKTNGDNGWLCSDCLKEKWKYRIPYGLKRFEGVEYPCDCYASGTNEKGQIVIIEGIRKHDPKCSLFRKNKAGWSEPVCDCPNGSTVNDDGSLSIHDPTMHDRICKIRKNFSKYSTTIDPRQTWGDYKE